MLPKITRLLPVEALQTLAEGLRMDLLAESLDADMVRLLQASGGLETLDAARYAQAWQVCGRRAEREEQIGLVLPVGRSLDRLTRVPMIAATLKLMRRPAELAGLGELHSFLSRGFEAFRQIGRAHV